MATFTLYIFPQLKKLNNVEYIGLYTLNGWIINCSVWNMLINV